MLLYSGTEGVVPSHAADYSVTWMEVNVSSSIVSDILADDKLKTGGCIYAIGAEGHPHVKIGSTQGSVEKRLVQLQTGYPGRLAILATVAVQSNLIGIETRIHTCLIDQHVHGEWFAIAMSQALLEDLVFSARKHVQSHALNGSEQDIVDDILSDRTLSAHHKMLLIVIAHTSAHTEGFSSPSLRQLARRSSLSLAHVCTLLKDLEARGYLNIQRGHGTPRGNVYMINRARFPQP